MRTHKSLEGYLLIDHSATGAPGPGGLRGKVETSTLTCGHCQRQMIRNPLRTRERAYAPEMDRYICDECALVRKLTGKLKPFTQIMDEHCAAVVLQERTHG